MRKALGQAGIYRQKVFLNQWLKMKGTEEEISRHASLWRGNYFFRW